jgi:multidrug resistance efflux pump
MIVTRRMKQRSGKAEAMWAKERGAESNNDAEKEAQNKVAAEEDPIARLRRIGEELREQTTPATPPPLPPSPTKVGIFSKLRARQGLKSLVAVAVALALGWIPLQRLLATTSAEATVNARLVKLRAPIEGKVSIVAAALAVGEQVDANEPLLRVDNLRADRGKLDDLRRTISALTFETEALTKRVDQLKGSEASLLAQRDAFQEGRIRQLESRAAEIKLQITSAEAMHADAAQALERSKKLNVSGSQTIATLLHAERDFKTSQLAIEAARTRLAGNSIELESARKGLFVGDSYNDVPRSAQRLDEVRQQILDATSKIHEDEGRLEYLKKELATEQETLSNHLTADVNSTVRGRIWEVLTANGEEVSTGQELLRVLDCAGAVVTATVSEAVYNKLWVGQTAHFRLRGESKDYPGTVVGLTGISAAGSNFAIDQTGLTREPYHVTVAVPDLAARRECNVGRTGQITFDTSATASADEMVKTAGAD